jgi:hypothetical protein
LQRKDKEQILTIHRNAQRLLKPLAVVNPYAEQLTFIDDRTRTRRDHEKYLTLIESITLLHQYQRQIKTTLHDGKAIEYIEVTLDDIELANQLAHEILGRTLDELPPQTRNLLLLIDGMVSGQSEQLQMKKSDYRFSRREIREYCNWTDFQVKTHMHKLEELEYVLVHRGSRGKCFIYELLYDGEGQDNQSFMMGLMNINNLKHQYDTNKEHTKSKKKPSSSPQVVPKEHSGRSAKSTRKANKQKASSLDEDKTTPEVLIGNKNNGASYNGHAGPTRSDTSALAASPE